MNVIDPNTNSLLNSLTYKFGKTIIDPGDMTGAFKLVHSILLTHAHFDHIYGLNRVLELNPDAKVYTNGFGKEMLLDAKKNLSYYHESPMVISREDAVIVVKDEEEISLEKGTVAKAFFTPGHNPSCITWAIGEALFTGDSYIPGIKVVTNLPGGNKEQASDSLYLINKLAVGRTIYPGHRL